jgi:hypothetical protein
MPENITTVRQAQVQNTSVKTNNQNPSLNGNDSMDSTNRNQTQGIERSTFFLLLNTEAITINF